MDGNSRLSLPSNLEFPLMNEVSDLQQSSGGSGGGLSGSITACKKVLRSNSLLESTDYWLQNQRTPCQIGFVEDKSESCASVCFVNLDVNKDASDVEHLRQKLVNVSPDLPKLINSMTVQQPKENEIVLLSGLASGSLQADFDVSQCPWLSDICLVQCARGSRRNSTNCIIFEINKFLIGLELVQERQLPQETGISKLEDDTNCSLSSIEEDFLTASEHLEEENEVEDYRNSYENLNVSATVVERKKPKKATQEEWEYQEKLHCSLEDKYVSTFHASSIKSEASQESNTVGKAAEENLNPPASPSQWKGKAVESEQPTPNYRYPESFSVVLEQGSNIKPRDAEDMQNSPPSIQNGEVTTGEYATNLAESVLQDAFIRLSRPQPTPLQEPSPPQESATRVSVASTVLPSGHYTKDPAVPRSWNELPKIVIVQSSDGSDVALEPGVSSWPETEGCAEVPGILSGESSNRHPQSALEVALACAATVIGTISSPQATERLTMEQESLVSNGTPRSSGVLQTQAPPECKEPSLSEYSFPSALCGMTQVASAVAVCGLGEPEEGACPVAPGGLLPTAGAAEQMPTACSLVAPGKEAIAQALLAEAALVLARPDTYSSIDDLLESVSQRITEATSKSRTLCLENVLRNELAQMLSNIILKHSMDEVHQRNNPAHLSEGRQVSETLDALLQSVNQLLHSVMCLTFKKMSRVAQLTECPAALSQETLRWTEADPSGFQLLGQTTGQAWTKVTACSSGTPLSKSRGAGVVLDDLVTDLHEKQDKGRGQPGPIGNPRPQFELSCGHRALDSSAAQTFSKEIHPKGMVGDDTKTLHQTPRYEDSDQRAAAEKVPRAGHCDSCVQHVEDGVDLNPQGKNNYVTALSNDAQVNLSLLGEDLVFPAQSLPQAKHSDAYSSITDFAEELAETVVSMATEIAAICLDNSNGKQPWFCAWKRGNEFLVTPNGSCRSLKRKKETLGGGGSTVRKHKPPRLSEIKRKTDEHPELKEKLMNRVMDESVNLEDVPDSVDVFANEVAAKIMSLTEFSMVDGVWQAQGCSRNRLLGGDRWNRLKASSCESIPEEDSEVRGCVNSLGLMSTLSRPVSRASSVSKQSSCESITEEFSRFMVNQMENEGRGFELLLDYYAGKNASSIVSSAVRQACRPNDHLSVRPSCPSKQSSTESITEEFYRYMLRDIERESKDGALSRRGSHDWTAGLLSPSARSPLCYRQSSVPDSRTSCSRLTVNAPIKANSLDGFAQHCPQDFLSVQPVPSVGLSSGLCKSDTCLYRRGGTDQITNMLIHETWASSIEALMRKNKIIVDDNEERAVSGSSPLKVEKRANRLAACRACKSPTLLVQESIDHPRKDVACGSKHSSVSSPSKTASVINLNGLDSGKETSSCHESSDLSHPRKSLCSRDVPLIQIETDQREECIGEPEPFFSKIPVEGSQEHQRGETSPGVARSRSPATSTCDTQGNSTASRDAPEAEVSTGAKAPEEFPSPPSSSEDSTGCWSQLANEDDNADDTSSFLQLSERSMSNGNSSATSSVGIMDLDIYQESMPSSPMTNELVEEKESLKEHSESIKEHASGLPGRTASPQKSLLVINFDLEPECPDAELRATLQWIAASELGIPTIYFKKSQESRIEKFLDVVQLVHQKSWKVGDIFHAVVQYCKMHAEKKEGTPSLFDWLLELG